MTDLQCRKIFSVIVLLQKRECIHRSSIDSTIDLLMFAIKHSNSWRRKKGFTPTAGYGTMLMQHCNTLINTFLTSIGRVRVADSWFDSITNEPSDVTSMKEKTYWWNTLTSTRSVHIELIVTQKLKLRCIGHGSHELRKLFMRVQPMVKCKKIHILCNMIQHNLHLKAVVLLKDRLSDAQTDTQKMWMPLLKCAPGRDDRSRHGSVTVCYLG